MRNLKELPADKANHNIKNGIQIYQHFLTAAPWLLLQNTPCLVNSLTSDHYQYEFRFLNVAQGVSQCQRGVKLSTLETYETTWDFDLIIWLKHDKNLSVV